VPNSKGQPSVYVSSTFIDLEGHRAALKTALEKARYDVECMEKYTAFDQRPLDRCLADVAATDVYVLLIAHRYGYRPPENNPQRRSITQLEYEQASRHNKPRLVFTVNTDHDWKPKWIDSGEAATDLAAFRAEVEASHGVNRFTTPDQLASLVLQALQALRPPSLDSGSPQTRIYTPAGLQSWVDLYKDRLEKAFLGLPSVQARQVHVPLDVCLTLAGAVTEGPRLLRPEDLEPLLAAAGSHVLLLSGDGGAGKTSLAFAIARRWLTGELDGVVRLPVLIETALAEGETVTRKVGAWLEEQLGEPQAAELVAALLRGRRLVPAQNQLRRIVGDKPITALLAQMFIDDVIANRQRGLLAGSVPQLMLSYVRRLDTPVDPSQRERAGLTIDGERVQRALKCLALASHRQLGGDGEPGYQPREFSRALAKETLQQPEPEGLGLNGEAAEGVLGYLGERRLLVHPGEDSSELRFPLDPLADYLAALAQLEVLETTSWSTGQKAAWEAFLAGLEQRLKQAADLSRSRGFFLALRDAALERRGRGVPEEVPDRLAELGGLNPEQERERLAEQRARKWMWELLVPIASERRDAISKLAAMAAAAAEPEDRRSVAVVASDRLSQVLANGDLPGEERQEAAVVLGLIGTEIGIEALERLASDGAQPPELRRAALESLGLTAKAQAEHRPRIEEFLEGQLRADSLDLLVTGEEGWAEHDLRLPPLQGASRAMQLAAPADLPLLGSGPGRAVAMLTLTALQEGEALRIRTEVVTPAVWRLPLPGGDQLELVMVEGGEAGIGSPETEGGRDWYANQRDGCKDPQTQRPLNVEAERTVRLERFALVRHLITQAQWQSVTMLPQVERDLNPTPGSYKPDDLWERFAQPGGLPVDSVSWNDCQEWLGRLNRWLLEQWSELGAQGDAPQLALPGEGQWEVACRAGAGTPFHFGDALDACWANVDGGYTYGSGRKGAYRQRPVSVGFFGLVNRWGLAELHGQLFEW
jgi:formylglycine-generating enzyme required for sulfatase activity